MQETKIWFRIDVLPLFPAVAMYPRIYMDCGAMPLMSPSEYCSLSIINKGTLE